jgi:hypothetical protein
MLDVIPLYRPLQANVPNRTRYRILESQEEEEERLERLMVDYFTGVAVQWFLGWLCLLIRISTPLSAKLAVGTYNPAMHHKQVGALL